MRPRTARLGRVRQRGQSSGQGYSPNAGEANRPESRYRVQVRHVLERQTGRSQQAPPRATTRRQWQATVRLSLLRAAASLALAALVTMASGCEDRPTRPELPTEPPAPPAGVLPEAGAAPPLADAATSSQAASAVSSATVQLREQTLTLSPQPRPRQRLVFGRNRLARLTEEAATLFETKGFTQESSLPLQHPRRAIELKDGSLLLAEAERLLHLATGAAQPESFPRVPLFAESLIFGDRIDPSVIWLCHGFDPTLYRYRLEPEATALLHLEEYFALDGTDLRGFAALKDGSFAFVDGQRLHRRFPGGRHSELALPDEGGRVWRLLPTRRVDQLWIAYEDGRLVLVQLGPRLRKVRTLTLPTTAFDIAANDRYVVVVVLSQSPGHLRRWSLVGMDNQGKQVLTVELPNDHATSGPDWVAAVTRNKEVSVSRWAPLVAVGGPSWLGVWHLKSGRQLLRSSE